MFAQLAQTAASSQALLPNSGRACYSTGSILFVQNGGLWLRGYTLVSADWHFADIALCHAGRDAQQHSLTGIGGDRPLGRGYLQIARACARA